MINHRYSDKMTSLKITQKLLEMACHDTQLNVQESTLSVLRVLCQHEKAKKVIFLNFMFVTCKIIFVFTFKILKDVDAIDKLYNINFLSSSSNLNSSIKVNYMNSVNTCKYIIHVLESS